MNTLLIETATPVCSVALAIDGAIVDSRCSDAPNAHSTQLPLFIHDLMPSHLDAVCVSSGPGSYTGLRIGVSTAKGICYALGIPLLSLPTPLSMATLYYMQHPNYEGLVCPMIDARRMECYTMIAKRSAEGYAQTLRPIEAEVICAGTYDQWLSYNTVAFIGNGAEKTRPLLEDRQGVLFDSTFCVSAQGMLPHIGQLIGSPEDVAYFEPFYLKDFVAKKSVVHGLR